MKKVIALAALFIGVSFTLTACAPKDSPEDSSMSLQTTDEQSTTNTSEDSETTTDTSSIDTTGSNASAAGGNPEIATYIEVTVSEEKYFYENHEILYDDLTKMFDELDENTVVKISDENAALKAYESLIKALEERGILFEAAS